MHRTRIQRVFLRERAGDLTAAMTGTLRDAQQLTLRSLCIAYMRRRRGRDVDASSGTQRRKVAPSASLRRSPASWVSQGEAQLVDKPPRPGLSSLAEQGSRACSSSGDSAPFLVRHRTRRSLRRGAVGIPSEPCARGADFDLTPTAAKGRREAQDCLDPELFLPTPILRR